MICPLYQQSLDCPNDPYLILQDRTITYMDLHQQAIACEAVLHGFPTEIPLALDCNDPFALLSWLFAAARTGHWIAIPSTKDPSSQRDQHLREVAVYTESLHWTLPKPNTHPLLDPEPNTILDPDARWCMLFTSGSSGYPKAVVHSFSSLWSSARFSHDNIPLANGDRWLQSLFLWHIGGLMIPIRALFGGAAIVAKDPTLDMGSQVDRDRITHLSVVATQLHDLLQGDHQLQSLKAVLVGGGTIPSKLVEKAYERTIPIHTTYGMTELGSQLSTTPPNSELSMLQSAGIPLGDWEIRFGEDQEIQVKGSPLFLGYWNGSSIEDPRQDGWFGTKDRGKLIDGCLYPSGRVDQMFISGGENIHPEEIEAVLHDLGIFSIVVPIPHNRYGKRPVIFILAELSNNLEERIRKAFTEQLPKFKHPDAILPWPESVNTYKPSRRTLTAIATKRLQ